MHLLPHVSLWLTLVWLGCVTGQALLAGEFAVDTFFTIGAFIAAFFLTQHLIAKLRPPAGERPVISLTDEPPLAHSARQMSTQPSPPQPRRLPS